MRELAEGGGLGGDLVPGRLDLLCLACALHADGLVTTDPTVGACWDADRLNLWRVGLAPARAMLSTAAASSAEVYDWSRGVHAGDVGWPELLAEVTGRGVGCREVGRGRSKNDRFLRQQEPPPGRGRSAPRVQRGSEHGRRRRG